MTISYKINLKKKNFVDAYQKSLGNISSACKKVNISRQTYYEWYRTDDNFKQQIDDTQEMTLDFAENSLLKQIKDGNTTATIFYLKTKGKHRGYVERQELTGKDGKELVLPKITAEDIEELKQLYNL